MSRMKKQMEKLQKIAYKTYNKLCESETDNIFSKRIKLQDLNFTQLKLQLHDFYMKNGKNNNDF